jgi:hypothetical protein
MLIKKESYTKGKKIIELVKLNYEKLTTSETDRMFGITAILVEAAGIEPASANSLPSALHV